MSGSTIIVLGIISFYLFACLILGIIAYKKKAKSTSDFFVAAGSISPFIIMATFVATQFSSYTFLGGAGFFFSSNIMPGLFELVVIIMSPVSLIVGLRIYKLSYYHKMVTPSDFITARFGSCVTVVVSTLILGLLVSVAFSLFYVSVQLVGSAYTLSGLTFHELDYKTILVFFTIVMAIYTVMGGFRAVAYTDTLQLVMCFFLLMVMGGIIVSKYGGLSELFSTAVEVRPQAFEYTAPLNYLGFLAPLCLLGYLYMPHMLVRVYAAKNVKGILYMILGAAIGGTLMVVIMSTITGSAISIFAPEGMEGFAGDQLIIQWSLHYMGPVISALLLSGAIAASFSTADSILLMGASVIINDICEKTLKVQWDQKKTMRISQVFVIIMIGLAFWGALNPDAGIIKIVMSLSYPGYSLLVPVVLACFWKRANKWGILTGLIAGAIMAILTTFGVVTAPFGAYSMSWLIIWTALAIVAGSLLTPPPSKKESLENFFNPKVMSKVKD